MGNDDGGNLDRWRGNVDAQLESIRGEQDRQSGKIELVDTRVQKLELKVEMLATKLVIFSALGATAGSAVVSIIVGIIMHVLSKG